LGKVGGEYIWGDEPISVSTFGIMRKGVGENTFGLYGLFEKHNARSKALCMVDDTPSEERKRKKSNLTRRGGERKILKGQ